MHQTISVALNIRADGTTVREGEHSPGTSTGIGFEEVGVGSERVDVGTYRVYGPGIAVPEGWRASVFRDENDQPTVFLAISAGDGYVEYRCTQPGTDTRKDIVNLLTVRVTVNIEVPEMPELPEAEEGQVTGADDEGSGPQVES